MATRRAIFEGTEEDRPGQAVGFMLVALVGLSLQDALIRLASPESTLWTFQFLRSTLNLVMLLALARVIWGRGLRRPLHMGAVLLRSACMLGCMIFFFGGLPEVTLSQMAAGLYTFPVFVTLFTLFLPGERVGVWRLGAVALGALGAALILRPWTEEFTPVQVMPVISGACYAGGVLCTRHLCRRESPVTLAIGVSAFFWLASVLGLGVLALVPAGAEAEAALPFLARGWVPVTGLVLLVAALASCLNVACNMVLAKAYQSGEPSWLAPFDYSYLGFAAVWGFLLFGAVPDGWTIAGSLLIAIAGMATALRERARRVPVPETALPARRGS